MHTPTVSQTKHLVPSSAAVPPSQDQVDAMADSIKDMGILMPIVVRMIGNRYEITPGGGQIRWLAAKRLGIDIVPIRVAQLESDEMAAASLIVNMERESIAPEETVASLERLTDEFGVDAADIIREHLPKLRESTAADPDLQDRLKDLLIRCGIELSVK